MSVPLRAETRRLRRAFVAILLSAGPAAATYGCNGTGGASGNGGAGPAQRIQASDAGRDRDVPDDAVPDQAAPSADAASDGDAAPDASPPCDITYSDVDAGPDAPEACVVGLPCGLPLAVTTEGCQLLIGGMLFGCALLEDAGCIEDAYAPPESGVLAAECVVCPVGGGRGSGRRRRSAVALREAEGPLASYFVHMAREEHTSIAAFERLERELSHHGAPAALVAGAARSAREEARHTRVMRRLAQAHGARADLAPADMPRSRASRVRALPEVARENAVEGCVRETLGALVLAWQSAHAEDPAVRRAFASIARDELRHAALSWAVARWARGRLDGSQRGALDRSMRRALARLRGETTTGALGAVLGLPPPEVHRALVDGLARELQYRYCQTMSPP